MFEGNELRLKLAVYTMKSKQNHLTEDCARVVRALRDAADEFERDAAVLFAIDASGNPVPVEERLSWMITHVNWVYPNLPLANMALNAARYSVAKAAAEREEEAMH